jgi:hypothetical protein
MAEQPEGNDGHADTQPLAPPTGNAVPVAPVVEIVAGSTASEVCEEDGTAENGSDANDASPPEADGHKLEEVKGEKPAVNEADHQEADDEPAPPPPPPAGPPPEPAEPWATDAQVTADRSKNKAKVRLEARDAVLLMVDETRSALPTWQRALANALTAVGSDQPAADQVKAPLAVGASGGPAHAAAGFAARDGACRQSQDDTVRRYSAHSLLGSHAENLVLALEDAAASWDAAIEAADGANYVLTKFHAQRAAAALGGAMQHAMYLTFLRDAASASVGTRTDVTGYCAGWGLSDSQVAGLVSWVKTDGLQFGPERLPLALDSSAQGVYKKASAVWLRACTALAPIWGGALVYGLVVLFFAILHTAGITAWPKEWGAKLLAVVICVTLGALAHIAARGLNISYDNPISVYNAGGIWDWLSLRWLGVLYMFIPVAVVVALLWGSKTYPGSFKDLGAAILAGYSADSLVRTGITKLQQQSGAAGSAPTGTSATGNARSATP